MSARQLGPYDGVARKWLALAERRHAHLIELRSSGRWKHYFTESELDTQLRELNLACDRFAKVAGGEPATSSGPPAERGGDVVSLHDSKTTARANELMEFAIEAALSAAALLQETAGQSAA
jgi:hypothetical protein